MPEPNVNHREMRLSAMVVGTLVVSGLMAAALLWAGRRNYPDLHTILDTGIFLLTAVLALFFWDVGGRLGQAFPRWIAVSFALTALLKGIHAVVTVEWS